MNKHLRSGLLMMLFMASLASGDVFTHRTGDEVIKGYVSNWDVADAVVVTTEEGKEVTIDPADYEIKYSPDGRKAVIPVLTIPTEIALEMETKAFEEALVVEASKGPLLILIEIDSPGGRTDLAMRICSALRQLQYCKTVAFIPGGKNAGALSAAAAVSMACDEIYMSTNSVIGAATVMTMSETGKPMELREVLGERIGEKMGSAWRNYLASLAESGGRPGILAKAMEDIDIEAVEVKRGENRLFLDRVNVHPGDTEVKIWCKAGDLLTLTAKEAVASGMADGIAESRSELLRTLDASEAKVVINQDLVEARELAEKVEAKLKKVVSAVDGGLKEISETQSYRHALSTARDLVRDARVLLMLKKRFGDDIPYTEERLQDLYNTVDAWYTSLKTMR